MLVKGGTLLGDDVAQGVPEEGRVVREAVRWVYTGPAPGGVDAWKPKTMTEGHPESPVVT